jgi:hypothetical protein
MSCAAKQRAIDGSSFTIFEHRGRSARRVKIAQCHNNGLAGFRKWRDGTHDPGDRFRIIGIDQNIVLDIQQGSALQLAGQSTAIPEIFVQPPRQQPHRVAVADLRGGAQSFVKRAADNAIVVDQRQRFIGDQCLEPILGCAYASDVCRACLSRDVVDPVPAQSVIVDLEFPRCPLDRGAGGQKPFDPLAFEMIAPPTSSRT